jgi:hypothetical protein
MLELAAVDDYENGVRDTSATKRIPPLLRFQSALVAVFLVLSASMTGCSALFDEPARPLASFDGPYITGTFCGKPLWIRRDSVRSLRSNSVDGWKPGTPWLAVAMSHGVFVGGEATVLLHCMDRPSKERWPRRIPEAPSPFVPAPEAGLERRPLDVGTDHAASYEYRPLASENAEPGFRFTCSELGVSHCTTSRVLGGNVSLSVDPLVPRPERWREFMEFPNRLIGVGEPPGGGKRASPD